MGTVQEVITGLMSTVTYAVIVFAVVKIYAISVEVSEIKELLKDIKRNTEDHAPAAFAHATSPESLIRAVHASSYPDPEVEEAGEINK